MNVCVYTVFVRMRVHSLIYYGISVVAVSISESSFYVFVYKLLQRTQLRNIYGVFVYTLQFLTLISKLVFSLL